MTSKMIFIYMNHHTFERSDNLLFLKQGWIYTDFYSSKLIKTIICIFLILVGLTLDEPCYVDRQCTGIPNSGVCMANINNERVCHCNHGYIKYNESCFKGNCFGFFLVLKNCWFKLK